jgi:selenide,water dikinase
MVTPRGARPGDRLFLTKPLGTGVIATAHKAGTAEPADLAGAVRWMTALNAPAARAMVDAGASAATDITGFGLLGHLSDLCRASGVSASISFGSIPLLPSALSYAHRGTVPGGTRTNWQYLADRVEMPPEVDEPARLLLADPQTSGGLLVALSPGAAHTFRAARRAGFLTAEIGQIEDGAPGHIIVSA